MNKKIIILDRDGVINYDSNKYIKSPDEWLPIPGSLNAIAELHKAGFKVVVATNQSGIARGLFDLETLLHIHQKLNNAVQNAGGASLEIFFCPHHPNDQCDCRKPRLGLFHQIQKKYNIRFEETFFIGDSHVDMQAAKASGCKPILVRTGNGQKTLDENPEWKHVPHFADLAEAVEYIIKKAS